VTCPTAIRSAAKAIVVGVLVGAAIVAVATGLFVAIWGWARFLQDFWPLDNSRIGPNLCASITIVILITAHNEYRVISKAEARNESARDVFHDALDEVLHPAETAEQHVADRVVDAQNGVGSDHDRQKE
jgi:hypothetical protein